MNHYPHHIGDFNNATRHLTRVERSLYRDLIELYYDTEQALNGDFEKLARRIICEDCDKPALRDVLNEYFVLQDDGWHNHRCDAEIAKYQGQIEQASRAGRASAAKRSNPNPTSVERPLNDRSNSVDVPLNQPEPEPEPLGTNVPVASKLPTCPVDLIAKAYHEILPELPSVRMMDDGRKKAIKDRWKWVLTTKKPDGTRRAETVEQATDWFKSYFERARDNDFLMGRTPRTNGHTGWKCDIDFLMTTKGLKQVIEKTEVSE